MKKTHTSISKFNIIKRLALLFVFAVSIQNTNAQQRLCNEPNPSFCPGNFFQNGDFETITGDPEALLSQDIDRATGWQAPWQGPLGAQTSLADLHCSNGQQQIGTIPTPNSFVFAGMWVENRPATNTTTATFREGMYNRLATPIAQNTGTYTFNFNIANAMVPGLNNNPTVSIGIYGVFNPNNIPANAPGGSNANPVNINLWQSVNQTGIQPPVLVVLLGTFTTPNNFTNTWVPQSVTFNSAILPPGGITHILITADDTARPQTYRKIYVNFDDFCLQRIPSQSVYCCDADNLITNGNIKKGNIGFVRQ